MTKDVIIALDFDNIEDVENLISKFKKPIYVKVGIELFFLGHKDVIKLIKKYNHKIFLDLKLHDIPNTVSNTIKILSFLEVDMLNVHALGGIKMMHAAKKALNKDIVLIAVTQLTSTNDEMLHEELNILTSTMDSVLKLATNAKESGLDGVVCSALEVKNIKEKLGNDFICVTPGIRRTIDNLDDQCRVVTPTKAREIGCDYIVVGRPITKTLDPIKEYNEIKKEFLGEK